MLVLQMAVSSSYTFISQSREEDRLHEEFCGTNKITIA
jgi:hypothetical protein